MQGGSFGQQRGDFQRIGRRSKVETSGRRRLTCGGQSLHEAGFNDIVFFGIAVFFLLSIETRVKRRRALTVLHELRSLAHIVDMHQLTKDPALISADREMSPAELGRYLDFCSDILSLISKVAALLVQHFGDGVVLAAVNEIETLTTGLSRKVWQKITILERPSLSS